MPSSSTTRINLASGAHKVTVVSLAPVWVICGYSPLRQSGKIAILWVRHRSSTSKTISLCVGLGGLRGTHSCSLVIDTAGKVWLEVAPEALRSSYSSKGFSTVSDEEKGWEKMTIPGVVVIKSANPQCLFMEIVPCRETD